MSDKALVLLSGGMDSATLLYWALSDGYAVEAISFNYGQRHFRKEYDASVRLLDPMGLKQHVIGLHSVAGILKESSSVLVNHDNPVPHGHYAEENMSQTVVPNRNMMFLSIAASVAMARRCDILLAGMHAGDHPIYPDCRPEFIKAFDIALTIGMEGHQPPKVFAPFITSTKADIAGIGKALGVPYELTWSCYEGGEIHCGRCGTCIERREAFEMSGVVDKTPYADSSLYEQLKVEGKICQIPNA